MNNNDLLILFPDLRHGWFDAKIKKPMEHINMNALNTIVANAMENSLSLGKLALMSMIFLVPQALRRKFTLMVLCLLYLMMRIIMIATLLNLLPLQLIKLIMPMWRVIILCMRLMIRMLYVIVILLSLLMFLLKVIMREENMVVEIFMLLKHLSMC